MWQLLFLIYIKDIINFGNYQYRTVYVRHDSVDGAIQIPYSELAKVAEWFHSNKLPFNVNKTQMLMLSGKKSLNPQGDVILHIEAIQRVAKEKFFGVIVDQLTPTLEGPHINGITQYFRY